MKLKSVALGLLAAATLTACGGNTAAPESSSDPGSDSKSYKIGVATLLSHDALDAVADGFKEGLKEAGFEEGKNLTIDLQNAQNDQSTLTNIANTFAQSDNDAYLAIATPTAQSLANAISDKPIAFAAVTDPVAAGLVESWEKPGSNVTGISDLIPMSDQLKLIQEAAPDVKSVGIVYSSGEVNSEVQVKEAQTAAAELGLEIKTATVTNSSEVQQAAESIDADSYLIPTDNTVVSAAESVLQVAAQKGRPVFASDEATMERGAAAGLSVNYNQQGKDAAEMVLKMLEGTPASDIPVATQKEFDLFVNVDGAAEQGLTLPEAVVSRAAKQF